MKQTEYDQPKRIADAKNCSKTKNFTHVPNDLLRNQEISGKSKSLLCLLLSNKEGWESYSTTINQMMKEGPDAINSGLRELEKHGYLIRFRYRDKDTRRWRGSFWAYTDTPNQFYIQKQIDELNSENLELYFGENVKNNPHMDFPDVGNPNVGNPGLKILNIKNIKNEKNQYSYPEDKEKSKNSQTSFKNGYITPNQFERFWEIYPRKVGKGDAKRKWNDICTQKSWEKDRPQWRTIRRALNQQKQTEQWQNLKYVPYPATWLNKFRWLNDANELNHTSQPASSQGAFANTEQKYSDEIETN